MTNIKTNTDFITDLMNFSEHGALIQAFVMAGLESYCRTIVSQNRPEPDPHKLICPTKWWDMAAEVQTKFLARHNEIKAESEAWNERGSVKL